MDGDKLRLQVQANGTAQARVQPVVQVVRVGSVHTTYTCTYAEATCNQTRQDLAAELCRVERGGSRGLHADQIALSSGTFVSVGREWAESAGGSNVCSSAVPSTS
jgi:hypothetical protein